MARRRLSSAVVAVEEDARRPWCKENEVASLTPVLPEGTAWRQDKSGNWVQQKYCKASLTLLPLASRMGISFARKDDELQKSTVDPVPSRHSSKGSSASTKGKLHGRTSSKSSTSTTCSTIDNSGVHSSMDRRSSVSSAESSDGHEMSWSVPRPPEPCETKRLAPVSDGRSETRRLSSLYRPKPGRCIALPPLQIDDSAEDNSAEACEAPKASSQERASSKSVSFNENSGDAESTPKAIPMGNSEKRASCWAAVKDLVFQTADIEESSCTCPAPPPNKPLAKHQRLRRLRELAKQMAADKSVPLADADFIPSSPQRTEAEIMWQEVLESSKRMHDVSFDPDDFAPPNADLLL